MPYGRNINTLFLQKIWKQTTTVQVFGKEILFHSPSWLTHYRATSILEKEPETIAWINNMEPGADFWDVGANVGTYSVYAAKFSGVNVTSIEPSFLNLELLFRNIQSNNLQEKIKILPLALSSKTEFQKFFMSSSNLEWGGAHNSAGERITQDGSFMENAISSYQLNVTAIDLINLAHVDVPKYLKIDVDGLEISVLQGFGKFIQEINEILVEIDQRNVGQIELISKFLTKNGFVQREQKFGFSFDENQLWIKA